MSNSKTRLGRGLGGLISGTSSSKPKAEAEEVTKITAPVKKAAAKKQPVTVKPAPVSTTTPNAPGFREIEVKRIIANPYQPRSEIHP
jgi:ParB family chromosome partitioning protein